MDWKIYALMLVAFLFVANVITNGYAFEQIIATIESDQGKEIQANFMCLAGIYMTRPIREFSFFGIPFFIPFVDTDDFIIAAAITLTVITLVHLFGKEFDTRWWYLAIFVFFIVMIKAIGLLIILASTPTCLGMAILSSRLMEPLDWIMLGVGVPIISLTLIKALSDRRSQ